MRQADTRYPSKICIGMLFAAGAVFLVSSVAAQQDEPELLSQSVNILPMNPVSESFDAVRSVRLNRDMLARLHRGDIFRLTPEDGMSLWCTVTDISYPRSRVQVVRAQVDNDDSNTLILVTHEDATAMSLRLPSFELVYRLQYAGNDEYQVWRMDHQRVPAELCFSSPMTVDTSAATPQPSEPDDDRSPPEEEGGIASPGGCWGSTPVIDTLIVYTTAARQAIGSHSAMRAEAALAIEMTNDAYANSQNIVRARLVYCNEINYTESGSMGTDLNRLMATDDGHMDSVHALRDSLNADLVALFISTGSGVAPCPGSPSYSTGFSVSMWSLAAANLTHAHETGHNMGAGHDRDNGTQDGPCTGSPNYGVGWRFTGNDDIQYRTVMAYTPGMRIAHYSNPSVNFRGTPTGVPVGQPNEAHNARRIAENYAAVVGFERTRYDIYVDFSWILPEDGTPAWPYNTLPEGVTAIAVPGTGAAENPSLYIRAGSTNWTGVVSKAMVIRSCDGSVIFGN